MDKIFAGLDVSTQSLKIIILNLSNSSIIYKDTVVYDKDLPDYNTSNGIIRNIDVRISESNPIMWIDALNMIFERAKIKKNLLPKIKAISVSGQQHGLVSLNSEGRLTKPTSKLWNDFSTQEECDILTNYMGGEKSMISEIGNTQRTGYTASKIFHMYRNENTFFEETNCFFLVHNFINWYLTGGKITMEEGDASGTGLWDPVNKRWSEKIINSISKNLIDKLPKVESSVKSIGVVSKYFVEKYGFDSECKIDAGSGDNMYGAIGTGNVEPGILTMSLGTSGTAYTILKKPFVDDHGEIACFCDSTGNYMPLLCVSNMAGGYNNFLKENGLSHSKFNELLSFTDPGNNGNIILPWFEGERTPDLPEAAPLYFGFNLKDLNLKSISRGLMEGSILNLNDGFQRMPIKPKVIHLTGGLSVSKLWCQTISNTFNCETITIQDEGAALGAALHACWVWEKESGNEIRLQELIEPFIQSEAHLRCLPQKKYVEVYNDMKLLYRSLSKRMRGLKSKDPFKLRKKIIEKNEH